MATLQTAVPLNKFILSGRTLLVRRLNSGATCLIDQGRRKASVIAHGKAARTLLEIGDGAWLTVEGTIRTDPWIDARGNTRWHTDLVVESIRYEAGDRE